LQVGRFVARLDAITSTNEFRRADCAPRSSLGDGQLKVTDWVQAGRYLAGLDPLVAIGGPTLETVPTVAGPSASRRLLVANANVSQNQIATTMVNLEAQGDEHALGFTVAFDPVAFTFSGIEPGNAATGANVLLNTSQVGNGRLGVVLALGDGSSLSTGTHEVGFSRLTHFPSRLTPYEWKRVNECVQALHESDCGRFDPNRPSFFLPILFSLLGLASGLRPTLHRRVHAHGHLPGIE
jgi:hypothetical protein